jgi:ComF family protein
MFRALLQPLTRRLPSQCAVCHAWPADAVCEACVTQFAQPVPRCTTCALPLATAAQQTQCGQCVIDPPPLDACVAAVDYDYPWTELVAHYKFGATPGWAGALALLMRSAPWVEPALESADWVIPMPLSTQRLRERGFNQAALLAQTLAPRRTHSRLLLRISHAAPQSSLATRQERQHSVAHAFAVEPRLAPQLAGRRVVLLDDVMTSGASLYAAARVLRAAGAVHITGLVFARTDLPPS